MNINEVTFTRRISPRLNRAVIFYGSINDSKEMLTFEEIQEAVKKQRSLIPARVEAHWLNDTQPEEAQFCASKYQFNPLTGAIHSLASTIIQNSELGIGTVIHPNTTISGSKINKFTEVRNCSTIINSQIGNLCLVGLNATLEGQHFTDYIAINDSAFLINNPSMTEKSIEERTLPEAPQEGV